MTGTLSARAHRLKARGETVRSSAPLLGVSPATVQRALKAAPLCERCDAKLRQPSTDGLCGFCKEESK